MLKLYIYINFMLIKNNYNRQIYVWLISLISLIGIIIIVGGLTRLTNSGLSIIEWELFKGILPPLSNAEWINYFNLYKTIPQYEIINKNMSLDDFKVIFLWEYYHRLLARVIGLIFILPFVYFFFLKIFNKRYEKIFFTIFVLILLQGIIGWYMVKSGLADNVSVSHYRLSIHLFLAFVIFSSLTWIFFNLKKNIDKRFFINNNKIKSLKFLLFITYLQIIIGAFVSGLDAGKIYQTWPMMNDAFVPDDLVLSSFINLLNFSQHGLVQFIHRNLAYLIFVLSIYVGFIIYKNKIIELYKPYLIFEIIIIFQILLGIFTLLSNLRIEIASLHQISSIFLVYFLLNLYHKSIALKAN